jgi:hypothetical protein
MIERVPILEQKVNKGEKEYKEYSYKESIGQKITFRNKYLLFMFEVAFCVKEIKPTGNRYDKKPQPIMPSIASTDKSAQKRCYKTSQIHRHIKSGIRLILLWIFGVFKKHPHSCGKIRLEKP